MASARLEISIEKMPEVIWALRREIARILRDESDGEPEIVRRKLQQIAADFEVGV